MSQFSCDTVEPVLHSRNGLRAVFSRRGAALTALYAPDRQGRLQNIVYNAPNAFAGQIIAPVAGRIRGGDVSIHGAMYKMPCDKDGLCLHSGPDTTAAQLWQLQEYTDHTVQFGTMLPHGACGLPGNRHITARYTLLEDRLYLTIDLESDRDTFVNPTCHIYWNLSADFTRPAAGQQLQIPAEQVWYNDARHLPQDLHPTRGTVFDFSRPRDWSIFRADDPQLCLARGYNHAFALHPEQELRLYCPANGRGMALRTRSSHLVVYSGGYLPVPGCALALEPQEVPDAPYLLGDACPLLPAGHTFHWQTAYRFFVE